MFENFTPTIEAASHRNVLLDNPACFSAETSELDRLLVPSGSSDVGFGDDLDEVDRNLREGKST